jgi:hypothetical protein
MDHDPDPKMRSDCRHIALVFANLTKCKDAWVEALGKEEENMLVPDIIQTWMNKSVAKGKRDALSKARYIIAIQDAQAKLGESVTPDDDLVERSMSDLQRTANEYTARLNASE